MTAFPARSPLTRSVGAALATVALLASAACSGGDDEPAAPPSSSAAPTAPPTASAAPAPRAGVCYRLTYDEAVSPTSAAGSRDCKQRHTSETYAVGKVDNLVDGHLLAVDSARVQEQVAETCPGALGAHVGGSADDLRLSVLRPVWFTPSLEESDAGADWYRCDVVAVAGPDQLVAVRGSLRGVLATPAGRDRWGMCGNGAPDEPDFQHVPCSAPHTWRAISVVDLPDDRYPSRAAIARAGEEPCREAAGAVAADPLDYRWGFESPSREQWQAGQTYLRCWTATG